MGEIKKYKIKKKKRTEMKRCDSNIYQRLIKNKKKKHRNSHKESTIKSQLARQSGAKQPFCFAM